jgi:5-methyltetrahydropteroyltriglutamate--homocysteine methyltransferase
MQRTIPPFRADHVGSILRTAPLKEARAKKARGEIDAAALKAVEDAEIRKIIAKQEEVGLLGVTDGEFRRAWWHYDFLSQLDGVKIVEVESGIKFAGVTTKAEAPFVAGKLGSKSHPQIEHFKFLKENTKRTPKMTIPSPSMLHYRGGTSMIDRASIPRWTTSGPISAAPMRRRSRASTTPAAAICRSTIARWPISAIPAQRKMLRDRGDNPDELEKAYAYALNTALEGRPPTCASPCMSAAAISAPPSWRPAATSTSPT